MNISDRQKGIFLAFFGVLLITPDSLIVRLVSLDTWNLLFYRSIVPGLFVLIGCAIVWRKDFFNILYKTGFPGILNSLFVFGGNIFFILSLQNTDVANTLVMVSLIPLIAALISTIFLKESPHAITWLAMILCLLMVFFIFFESFELGRFIGDFYGLLTAVFVASSLTVLRKYNHINLIPSYAMGKILTGLFASFFATSFVILGYDIIYILLMTITIGFSFVLITLAPRYILSPEVGIFFLVETALGPLWVWLVINEVPTKNTLIGGIVILLIIFIHSLFMIKIERKNYANQ